MRLKPLLVLGMTILTHKLCSAAQAEPEVAAVILGDDDAALQELLKEAYAVRLPRCSLLLYLAMQGGPVRAYISMLMLERQAVSSARPAAVCQTRAGIPSFLMSNRL